MCEQKTSQKEMLTVSEVAQKLRVGRDTIRKLLQSGELHGVKVGHQFRIKQEDLEAFLTRK